MRRPGFDILRGGQDRTLFPGTRVFGTAARTSMGQRLGGLISSESLFRLILAFLLATALWLFVASKQNQGAFLYGQRIPISYDGIGSHLTLANVLPDIHVSVNSSQDANPIALSPASFAVSVHLNGLGPGRKNVRVGVVNPCSCVTNWYPQYVTVDIQPVITRVVPVRVLISSPPPVGFALTRGSVRTAPRRVSVSGAQSLVSLLNRAVVSLSLAGATSPTDRDVKPVLQNALGASLPTGLTITPALVRVHATIVQLSSYTTLPVVASLRGAPQTGLGVTSARVKPSFITVFGPQSAVRKSKAIATNAVNVSGLGAGKHVFTVGLAMTSGIKVGRSRVRVSITVSAIYASATTRVTVTVSHVPRGDTSHLNDSLVTVALSGPASHLSRVTRALRATVDAGGLSTGAHVLKVLIHQPNGVRIDSIQPPFVVLTLRH